jgi:hypothetical protein
VGTEYISLRADILTYIASAVTGALDVVATNPNAQIQPNANAAPNIFVSKRNRIT